MSKLFSLDSQFYRFMSRLLDMLKLNAMWVLCSIPIVTMGAATTAAYTITLKMVDEEEGYIAKPFLKEFKANLLKGSVIGIIQLIAMYAIYLDFQFYHVVEEYSTFFLVVGVIAIFMTVMHLIYAYPLLARYENSIVNTLRNSYSIAAKYFLKTLFLVALLVFEIIIIFWNSTTLFFGILIGPACLILTISGFARQFFRNIENENIQAEEVQNDLADEEDEPEDDGELEEEDLEEEYDDFSDRN